MMPKGTITVDVDGLWTYLQSYGLDAPQLDADPIYQRALPRMAALFEELDIRATFFVLGKDLENPPNRDLIRRLGASAHEIGSHTYNHFLNFRHLSKETMEDELIRTETAIEECVGRKPVGIRAPGWNINETLLQLLDARGYLYDSSVFPSPVIWSMKKVYASLVRLQGRETSNTTTPFLHGFAPINPYSPDSNAIWRRGDSRIVELPVSATGILRVPYYSTFYHLLGQRSFDLVDRHYRHTRDYLNFIFHPIDFTDRSECGALGKDLSFPGFSVPWKKKHDYFSRLLRTLKERYELTTAEELARAFCKS